MNNAKGSHKGYEGVAFVVGDDIDTDRILPGRYLTLTDTRKLGECVFSNNPEIAIRIKPGTILVAGKNFGCGSSREGAPVALKSAGMQVIIAESFARIFYRNAVNIGLIPIECLGITKHVSTPDTIKIYIKEGKIANISRRTEHAFPAIHPHILSIINAGGLVEYIRHEKKYENHKKHQYEANLKNNRGFIPDRKEDKNE